MSDVTRSSELKAVLHRHGFTLKKSFGQNFLIDSYVLDAIVEAAELTSDDGVFEVGPGAGVVTSELAKIARQVVCVEKDKFLRPVLDDVLQSHGNVSIHYEDVLETDLEKLWESFSGCRDVSVVANLPYYITTPILFHLLESNIQIRNIVVMVQKEVADRLAAPPGGKDYGALTVAVQYRAEVRKVVHVTPQSFLPPPGVDSTVVQLSCRRQPAVHVESETLFFRVVRAAFSQRRKMLLNAIAGQLNYSKAEVTAQLESCGIDVKRRGETLSIAEFANLSNALHHINA